MTGIRRITALTAGILIAAASFTGVSAATAAHAHASQASGFLAEDTADGPSASLAESAAIQQLHVDYSGCGVVTLVSDFSIGGGQWEATVESTCTGYN